GFIFPATVAIQLRLLPTLARTRPVNRWAAPCGIVALVLAVCGRLAGIGLDVPPFASAALWLQSVGLGALFWATGLWRAGLAPTMQAPATVLPGRTRQVLRVA